MNNTMRRFSFIALLIVAMLAVAGCGDGTNNADSDASNVNSESNQDNQNNDVKDENVDGDTEENEGNEEVGNVNEDNFLSEEGLNEVTIIESSLDKLTGNFKAQSTVDNQYIIIYDNENDTFEMTESFSTPSNAANLLVLSDGGEEEDKYEKAIDKLDSYEKKEKHGIEWVYGVVEKSDIGYVLGMKDNVFYNIQSHKTDYDYFEETVGQFAKFVENPIEEDAEIDYSKVLFPSLNKDEFEIDRVSYGDGSEEKILRIRYADNDGGAFTYTVTPESEPIDETYAYRNKVVSEKNLKTDNNTNVVANDFGEYAPTYIWKVDSYTYEIKMDQEIEYDEETILSMINSIK